MSWSLDPADYDTVKAAFTTHGVTPVILVLGGSLGQNTASVDSDLDLFGVYEEEEPESISIYHDERFELLGVRGNTQMTLHSMATVKTNIASPPPTDPARRMWFYEEFMSFPRIWDLPAAEAYRKELDKIPHLTVAGWYLESGDWYIEYMPDNDKFRTRVTRIFLSGARLLEVGDHVIDYEVLITWAGVSTPEDARIRLITAMG